MAKSLFDYLRGVKISTSLFVLFGLCAVVMGGQSGMALFDSWNQVRSTADVGGIALVNRELFTAVQYIRLERGPMRLALEAPAPTDPKMVAEFALARAKAAPAIEALIAACGQVQCADDDTVGNIRRAMDQVAAIRSKSDPALKLPLTARPAGLGKEWYDTSTVLVNELERVSSALTDRIRMVDTDIAELVGIKEAAWITRDAVGLERTVIQEIMVAKALSAEAKTRMATLRGQADTGWRVVKLLSARPGVSAPVLAAIKAAQSSVFDSYAKKRGEIEKAIAEGRAPPLTELELMNAANGALDGVVAVCTAALSEVIAHAERQAAAARMGLAVNAGGLLLALSIGATGFVFAWRRIARPIGVMSQTMIEMADGNLTIRMPYLDRLDEVGVMANATAGFRDNLMRMRKMEGEQKEVEARAAAERTAAAERDAAEKKAAEDKATVERKEAMHALAGQFEAAVGNIIQSVSSASTELEATATTLTKTAEVTQNLSGSVASASEQASANVQSVAASTEEMTSSVDEIGRQVQESSRIAAEAVKQAQKTDARISELSQAAGRIGDVLKLITAVAEQTNLLALNATIEAARAGEAGRGFAVVASEVKALAGQTAKATEEIGTQIAGMQAATGDSVAAIKEIGATIAKVSEIAGLIAAAVEEQGAATQEIARNVQQAAKGTAEVATNITEVNRGAAETGSASNQVLASARSLAGESNQLKLEVEKFLATVRAA